MDYALSGEDVFNAVKNTTGVEPNILSYDELDKYKRIEDVLVNDMCIILYQWKKDFGHWTCIMRRGDIIEHFDSYGMFPDKELSLNNKKMNMILGQQFPYLANMLINSGYTIHFNHHCFQGEHSSTCGRWVILRL